MLRFPMLAAMARQRRIGTFGGGFSLVSLPSVAAVYEPYDATKPFTERTSPTTQSTVGAVVGTLKDSTVNARDLSTNADSKRPILRAGVAGNYVEFDGTDDNLRAVFTLAVPYTRITLLRQTTWTVGDYMIDGSTFGSHYTFQSTTSPQFTTRNGGGLVSGLSVALGTWFVLTEVNDGASSKVKINNGSFSNLTFGATAPNGVTYGARGDGAGLWSNIDFGGGVLTSAALSNADIAAAVTFLGAKQGLTI